MPLLRDGRLGEDDAWVRLADEEPLPARGSSTAPQALGLARFIEHVNGADEAVAPVAGVWLAPTDAVSELAPWLDRLQLVAIDFPTYTDGRGYSQARQLRKRFGFGGELRAVGDVRPDQVPFMMGAGIDAFEFAAAPDESLLRAALSRYRTSYQPSYALAIAG